MLRQVSGEQADGRDGRRTGESRNRAGDGRDRKPVPPRGTDYFPCREPGSALWPVDRCGRTELLPVLSLKTPRGLPRSVRALPAPGAHTPGARGRVRNHLQGSQGASPAPGTRLPTARGCVQTVREPRQGQPRRPTHERAVSRTM